MDVPIPMRIFGYIIVGFGLFVVAAAVFLFVLLDERTITLVVVVVLEVIAGLASAGWGVHMIRSNPA